MGHVALEGIYFFIFLRLACKKVMRLYGLPTCSEVNALNTISQRPVKRVKSTAR